MKTVHANNSAITAHIARFAIVGTGIEPESIRLHPAQLCAISELFEVTAVQSIQELKSLADIEAVEKLAREYHPSTFMGLRIVQDAAMPIDEIEFRDEAGNVISIVTNLAVPVGLEVLFEK